MTLGDQHPDKIFVKDHLTDKEKLLFATAEIKNLVSVIKRFDIDSGALQSENDELKAQVRKLTHELMVAITKNDKQHGNKDNDNGAY